MSSGTDYDKLANVTPEQMKINSSSSLGSQELYNAIMKVLYNGYPNDNSNIKAKNNLTDDEFRAITQYAIWHFTDPNLEDAKMNSNERWKTAYNELIGIDKLTYPKDFRLNLYISKDKAKQNLMLAEVLPENLNLMITNESNGVNSPLVYRSVIEDTYNYYGYVSDPKDGSESSTNNQNYWMTTDGKDSLRVYCINHNAAASWGSNYEDSKKNNLVYKKVSGDSTEVASHVQKNNYGDSLVSNLHKILYYLETHQSTSTLTSNKLVWKVGGSNVSLTEEEEALYNSIITGETVPSNFVIELFVPKDSKS